MGLADCVHVGAAIVPSPDMRRRLAETLRDGAAVEPMNARGLRSYVPIAALGLAMLGAARSPTMSWTI